MSKRDLTKETLYTGVKQIIDADSPLIHLQQQKLYTLYSLAFNYMLYMSNKNPGHYIIRIEDSYLMDKIIKKAKDDTSRKFLQRMSLPRRLKYDKSMFHIDFFSFTTWANTNELPKEKIKGAIVVKNATKSPIGPDFSDDEEVQSAMAALPKDYYLTSLTEIIDDVIVIAYDEEYENTTAINFPFIKEEASEKLTDGVSISSSVNLDEL